MISHFFFQLTIVRITNELVLIKLVSPNKTTKTIIFSEIVDIF